MRSGPRIGEILRADPTIAASILAAEIALEVDDSVVEARLCNAMR